VIKGYKLYKWLGWICIGIAVVLSMLRLALPLYTPTPDEFNAFLKSKLPYATTTQSMAISWEGFHPLMTLTDVKIESIHIDKLKLVLSLKHLILGRLQLSDMVVDGVNLKIEYIEDDRIRLVDLPDVYYDLKSPGKNIPIDRLQMINSTVEINRQDSHITFENVTVNAKIDTHIKVRVAANVVGNKDATIEASVDTGLLGQAPIKAYVHWVGKELENVLALHPVKLPFAQMKGHVDLKLWLKWQPDDLHVTTNVELTDFKITSNQKKVLHFEKLGGLFHLRHSNNRWRITAEQGYWDEAKDFAFALYNEECQEGSCWQFKARHLPIKPFNDIAGLYHKIYTQYEVKGELNYINLSLDQSYKPIEIEMVFNDIGIFKPNEGGVAGMTGALVYLNNKGSLSLNSPRFNVHYTKLFSQVIPLSDVNAKFHWTTQGQSTHLVIDDVLAHLGTTPIEGTAVAHFSDGLKKLPTIETQWSVGSIAVVDALNLLPKVMDLDLLEWLNQAITTGEMKQTTFVMRGNLGDFPFDKHEGIFEVATQLVDAGLDYTQGWPALSSLNAELLFRNRALYINASHAFIDGGELLKAEAVIPDLFSPLPALQIDTKIKSTLENGLTVIQKSPLKETLGKELSVLTLQGPMDLSLGLDVPLSAESPNDVEVRGIIGIGEGTVRVPDWNIEIPHVNGEVSFTENSVNTDKLAGYLLESPAEFRITTTPTTEGSELRITASGKVVADRLMNWAKASDFKKITGDTDYEAALLIHSNSHAKQVDLTVNSNLIGLSIDAPPPIAKQANESKQSECKIYFDPNNLTRMSFKYGDNMNFAYSVLQVAPHWRPLGAHIHIGEKRLAKFREDGILLIDGDLAELDVEKWQQFAKLAGVGMSSEKPMLEPLVELKIDSLKFLGEEFTNAAIHAQWEGSLKHWNLNFDSQALKGHMILPQDDTKDILIDLQMLKLTSNNQVSSFWENQEQTQKKQAIDVKIKELNIDKKTLTQVQARLVPSAKGYDFNDVKANIKDTTIELKGEWSYLVDKKVTAQGTVTTKNIGDALLALGKEGTLKGANGTVDFALEWEGTPAKIDYPTLGGQAALSLRQGYVQGVNPGIGRILSLLNLDNVKRRLKLDFGDVTKSGFAFDELTAKFQFGKGKVSSNKIILNGPSAKIEAFGQADLITQGLSGEMVVMPDVTGSLPVAAAIAAGNPAIGAAVWVVDKMFGNKIQEINRFRYQILGSWQTPLVKEVPIINAQHKG
jgi:uncharacterized protein (TIGR02099 family)